MKEVLLTSSVLILAVIALRWLFRNKVSRRLVYGVWLLVALRLLIPIQFGQLDFSVLTQAKPVTDAITQMAQKPVAGPSREEVYHDTLQDYIAQGQPVFIPEVQEQVESEIQHSGRPAVDVYDEILESHKPESVILPEVNHQIEAVVSEKAAPSLGQIALWVWLAGIAVMAGWFFAVNLSLRRVLRRSGTDFPTESPVPVKVSAALSSPCLFGLFRPVIYLTPACTEEERHLRHVLTHEQTHLRHGDHIWAWVRCVCLCIYWFNPLVWVAAFLSKRDCELACDEAALKTLGEDERLAYGRTLVDLVASNPAPGQLLETATAMHETKKQLKERVNRIVKKPKAFLTAAIALLLVLTIVTGCAFSGAATLPNGNHGSTTPTTVPKENEIIESQFHADQQDILPILEALMNKDASSTEILAFEYDQEGSCAVLYRDTTVSADSEPNLMRLVHTSEGFRVVTDAPFTDVLPVYAFAMSELTASAELSDVLTAEALVSPRYGLSAVFPAQSQLITEMLVNVCIPMVLPFSEGAVAINESIQKTYNGKLTEIKRFSNDLHNQISNVLIDYDAGIIKDVLVIEVTYYFQNLEKAELTPKDCFCYYLELPSGRKLDYFDLLDKGLIHTQQPSDPSTAPTDPTTAPPAVDEITQFQKLFSLGYERKPYYYALSKEFSDPTELLLFYYFENGFSGEKTATEAELAELRGLHGEDYVSRIKRFYRFPKDKMEAELQKYFGISLQDLPDRAFHGLTYLESSDSYCYTKTWVENYPSYYHVQRVEHMSDGTVRVEYTINSTEHKNVLTLKPNGEDYLILSNEHFVIDDPVLAKFHDLFESTEWERNPYFYAIGTEFSSPEELRLNQYFDGGFPGEHEITDAEWAEVSKQLAYSEEVPGDFNRLPKDKIEVELQAVFGISLADLSDNAFSGVFYLECTDCYCFYQSGVNFSHMIGSFTDIHHNADGTISLRYEKHDGAYTITLKPNGDSYLVLSNVKAEN